MFERFTDRARRVVVLAQEESRLLGRNYIGPEHLLLGLIREGEGVAAQALASLDVGLPAMREQVLDIIEQGGSPPSGHMPFTPQAKRVFELSLREALQLGHDYIGTEHLLLGLVREGDNVPAMMLVRWGADLSWLRERVVELAGGPTPAPAAPPAVTARMASRVSASGTAARRTGELFSRALDQVVFRRFTVPACRVMLLAESEALRLGESPIGVEHLLLGLLAEGEGRAAGALGRLGIDLGGVRAQAERTPGRRATLSASGPAYAEDVVDAIERALYEALAAGSERIDTEHLLLGIVHQAENRGGLARTAFQVLDTTPGAVRRAVAESPPAQERPPDPADDEAPGDDDPADGESGE